MNKTKLAGMISLLCISQAWAIEPFIVKDIRIEGAQRTEAGTVFSYLPVKVGDTMDEPQAAVAIRALYATGFFKDVRLEVEQGVLIVLVKERPSIASIKLNGIKDFPNDKLKESMTQVGLAEARIFDKGVLEKAVQELKRQYVSHGKYAVNVKTTISDLERNRVSIVFDVVEGDASKIKQINLVGNHAYKEAELLDMMKLSTPDWMSWYSKNDQYSKQKLSADMETMRSFYMDNGYLEFNIDSTQVSITPDKKDIYITLNITEGEKYTISKVGVSGNTLIAKEEIEKIIEVKAGDTFSRKALTETTRKIGDRLGQEGYALANVNAIPELDKEKHQVAFNFVVDPGQRVYIRRINVVGNDKTRDEVIRREFRLVEGAWFDMEKIKKSKQRVDKLDYFSEVDLETPQVQGTNDQMDVKIAVKEKSTGNISIGAGFSTSEKLTLMAGVTQANIFGSGKHVSAQINTSKVNQVYSLSFTDPYFTDEGVSSGFDIYKRNTDSASTAVTQFSSHTIGGGIRFGVPIAEDIGISYGMAFESTELFAATGSSPRLLQYINNFGSNTMNLMGTLGWGKDTRDSAINTTQGTVQRAFMEVAMPVFDMRYYKLNYQHQWYHPVTSDITLLLNGETGVAGGYGGKPLPFLKNFYAGGVGSVRGYDSNSLGPRDVYGQALGGTSRVVANAELLFPVPGVKEKAVRLSGFIDSGAVYGPGDMPVKAGMRYSTGVALTWVSPMGPLKFSYGVPLNKQPEDKVQKFQFSMGSMF